MNIILKSIICTIIMSSCSSTKDRSNFKECSSQEITMTSSWPTKKYYCGSDEKFHYFIFERGILFPKQYFAINSITYKLPDTMPYSAKPDVWREAKIYIDYLESNTRKEYNTWPIR